jgi:hypothetical protein
MFTRECSLQPKDGERPLLSELERSTSRKLAGRVRHLVERISECLAQDAGAPKKIWQRNFPELLRAAPFTLVSTSLPIRTQ